MTEQPKFLTIRDLLKRYGIQRHAFWERRKDGKFPAPMPIGGHPNGGSKISKLSSAESELKQKKDPATEPGLLKKEPRKGRKTNAPCQR